MHPRVDPQQPDCCRLPFVDEDIKLNSTVFHWPEHIQKIFELSKNRIGHRRDLAMDDVKRKYVLGKMLM